MPRRQRHKFLGSFERLEDRLQMAADAFQAHDVNRDGYVSVLDALVVINRLNVQENLAEPNSPLNVNQDELISAADAVAVINYLNSRRDSALRTETEIQISLFDFLLDKRRSESRSEWRYGEIVFLAIRGTSGYGDPSVAVQQGVDDTLLEVGLHSDSVFDIAVKHRETGQGGAILYQGDDIRWIDDNAVEVDGGYIVGNLGAARYTFELQLTSNDWVVTKETLRSIS